MDNTANSKPNSPPLFAVIAFTGLVGVLLGAFLGSSAEKERAEQWKHAAEGWEKAAHGWEDQNKMIAYKCDIEVASIRAAHEPTKSQAN